MLQEDCFPWRINILTFQKHPISRLDYLSLTSVHCFINSIETRCVITGPWHPARVEMNTEITTAGKHRGLELLAAEFVEQITHRIPPIPNIQKWIRTWTIQLKGLHSKLHVVSFRYCDHPCALYASGKVAREQRRENSSCLACQRDDLVLWASA